MKPSYLAALIAAAGICGVGVYLVYPNVYTLVLPIGLLLGVLLSVVIRSGGATTPRQTRTKPITVAICICLTITTAIYVFNDFSRPLEVHLLTVLTYGLCGALIFSNEIAGTLAVVSTALLQRGMSFFASVLFMGHDSQFHLRMAKKLAEAGSREPLAAADSKYYYSAIYHYLFSESSLLLGQDVPITAFLAIGVPLTIVPVFCLYTLGRRYWTARIGALAGLIYISLDYTIAWSIRLRPMSLALLFFAVILLLFIRDFETPSIRYTIPLLFLFLITGGTHQSSQFTILVAITTLCIIYAIQGRAGKAQRIVSVSGMVLIGTWMETRLRGPDSSQSLLESFISIATMRLQSTGGRSAILPSSDQFVVGGAQSLNWIQVLPIGIIIALTCLGGIIAVNKSNSRSHLGFALLVTTGVMTGVALAGPLIGFSMLQPYRWWAFLYLPGALLAGIALATLADQPRVILNRDVAVGVLVIIVLPVAAISGMNHVGAPDGPVIDSPGADRFATTTSEAQTYSFLNSYRSESTVVTGDFIAIQTMARNPRYENLAFGETARFHQYRLGSTQPIVRQDTLVYHRDYAATWHGAYRLYADGQFWTVYGPISTPDGMQVYDSGSGRLIFIEHQTGES